MIERETSKRWITQKFFTPIEKLPWVNRMWSVQFKKPSSICLISDTVFDYTVAEALDVPPGDPALN